MSGFASRILIEYMISTDSNQRQRHPDRRSLWSHGPDHGQVRGDPFDHRLRGPA